MAADQTTRTSDATMDAKSLYREDIYTDRKVGTLRVLVPVKSDGSPDPGRKAAFVGEAQSKGKDDPEDLYRVDEVVPGDKTAPPVEDTGCKVQWPA